MTRTTNKVPKAVEFFEMLKSRALDGGYFGYAAVYLDITKLDIYVKDKKETVNVYEDVRKIVRKEQEKINSPSNKGLLERIDKLAELRIQYLKGGGPIKLTYEDAEKYIRNFKNYPLIFSDKAIKTAISNKSLKDFTTKKTCFEGEIDYMERKGYLRLNEGKRKRTVRRGRWEKEVEEHGVDFLVPDQYQLKESSFILDCLAVDYPYLKKYPVTVYHLDNPMEFYVEIKDNKGNKKGSLYIPYRALKERNPAIAINRMEEYFNSYYGTLARNEEKLKEQLGLMETKIAKQLFKDILNG